MLALTEIRPWSCAIVGVARLIGFIAPNGGITSTPDRVALCAGLTVVGAAWYNPGSYGWIFDERRPLATPVPCKGAQGLWRLPDEVERLVREQLGAQDQADRERVAREMARGEER